MSISGTLFIEDMMYPSKITEKGTWQIREMIGEGYKHFDQNNPTSFTKNVKMRYIINLPNQIYMKDILNENSPNKNAVKVGIYDPLKATWNTEDAQDVAVKIEEVKTKGRKNDEQKFETRVEFGTTELGIFAVLIERKINFPYKAWNLRCIKNEQGNLLGILDLITPRTTFVFELGILDERPADSENTNRYYPKKAYMKLIDNKEKEFDHIAGQILTFDQMILALKDCGILIAPWKEDIEAVGIREKNYETVNRAVDDIVMACRYYSIRSHPYNKLIETDLIAVKAKPNPEFDKYPFDDEEKDWVDFCWYPNKASIGKLVVEGEEKIVLKKTIETTRPKLHQIIKDIKPANIYEQIAEDDFSSAFLVNIRNVVRVLSLVNIP
jgi:hypothetical protein